MTELDAHELLLLLQPERLVAYAALARPLQQALEGHWRRQHQVNGLWHCPVTDEYLPYHQGVVLCGAD